MSQKMDTIFGRSSLGTTIILEKIAGQSLQACQSRLTQVWNTSPYVSQPLFAPLPEYPTLFFLHGRRFKIWLTGHQNTSLFELFFLIHNFSQQLVDFT